MDDIRLAAPFEHYMMADDRKDYPMVFWVVLSFKGFTQETRLKRAISAVIQRHPLLISVLKGKATERLSTLNWCKISDPKIYTFFARDQEPFQFPNPDSVGIDVSREPGVRIFIRHIKDESHWYIQFHHSSTDGTGAVRFIEDLLHAYDRDGDVTTLPAPAIAKLDNRLNCGISWKYVVRALGDYLMGVISYFGNHAQPMTRRESLGLQGESCSQVPERERIFFESSALDRLRHRARKEGMTINDVLLSQVFRSLDEWNLKIGKRKCIRVAVPVNLRRSEEFDLPAANMMGMAFIDRSGGILADSGKLKQSLSRQMRRIKNMRVAYGLNFAISLAGHFRGGVSWLCVPRFSWKCSATAVLSNLGDILKNTSLPRPNGREVEVGGLRLEALELLPPLRYYTNLSIGVVTYADRLCLSAHYDHTLLSSEEVQDFLQHMLYDLRSHPLRGEDVKSPWFAPLMDM